MSTVSIGREEPLTQLKAAPFDGLTFKADAVAVYQLGDFGTAAKKLWELDPKALRRHANGFYPIGPKSNRRLCGISLDTP